MGDLDLSELKLFSAQEILRILRRCFENPEVAKEMCEMLRSNSRTVFDDFTEKFPHLHINSNEFRALQIITKQGDSDSLVKMVEALQDPILPPAAVV